MLLQPKIFKSMRIVLMLIICLSLSSCGFHLQGKMRLAPAFKYLYLRTADPYGYLVRTLKSYLKLSGVNVLEEQNGATIILEISKDVTTQVLRNINSTTLTRQYEVGVTVTFALFDKNGASILGPESLAESRIITIQSSQILGGSNELNLYYQQMRRLIANAIMNRIASKQVTYLVNNITLKKHETKPSTT